MAGFMRMKKLLITFIYRIEFAIIVFMPVTVSLKE